MSMSGMLVSLACSVGGLVLLARSRSRTAREVLESIRGDDARQSTEERSDRREEPSHGRRRSLAIMGVVAGACGLAPILVVKDSGLVDVLIFMGLGAALSVLVSQRHTEMRASHRKRQLAFFLPLVMERIVMATEAGLDVVPALSAATSSDPVANGPIDAVTDLLKQALRLSERGMPLDEALAQVAEKSGSVGIRHAFIHLGLAHREGGELAGPLRELSDATQLYYQESIEEEISRLPAQATLPLVLIFAGLLLACITAPLLQVMKMQKPASFSASEVQ